MASIGEILLLFLAALRIDKYIVTAPSIMLKITGQIDILNTNLKSLKGFLAK